jgi:hypothetical protein
MAVAAVNIRPTTANRDTDLVFMVSLLRGDRKRLDASQAELSAGLRENYISVRFAKALGGGAVGKAEMASARKKGSLHPGIAVDRHL